MCSTSTSYSKKKKNIYIDQYIALTWLSKGIRMRETESIL